MEPGQIISKLESNSDVYAALLKDKSNEEILWKPNQNKWCLLEIVSHLYDEEREDFRTRVKTTLEQPGTPPPGIDPVGWVTERSYMKQDYYEMVAKFLEERKKSVTWLNGLRNPQWENSYEHVSLGTLTARHFLINWLAHDYMHFRQITRLQRQYLLQGTDNDLSYAGDW